MVFAWYLHDFAVFMLVGWGGWERGKVFRWADGGGVPALKALKVMDVEGAGC